MASPRILCVDLDGTLLRTDSFHEACLAAVRKKPWILSQMPFWLLRGKAYVKHRVHQIADLAVETLPFHAEFVAYLRDQAAAGAQIVLVTGAPQSFAERVAQTLGMFSAVHGSNATLNLTGRNKRAFLHERYGDGQYSYAGNAHADLPVWRAAAGRIVVSPHMGVMTRLRGTPPSALFLRRTSALLAIARSLRVHQWVKNILIFVPFIAAHRFFEPLLWAQAAFAFVAFSAGASAMYLLNDLLDLPSDRLHPFKRNRPLSAGALSIAQGIVMIFCCLGVAILFARSLPVEFAEILGIYLAASFVYSAVIKRVPILDVIVLAMLYTLRILAGGMATGVPVSFWLLTWSTFLFLSIAALKRYADLLLLSSQDAIPGRGYVQGDRQAIFTFGMVGGLLSVLLFSLYLNSDDVGVLYGKPVVLWLACPILFYWVGRLWFLAHRGDITEDPFLFITRDPVSYGVVFSLLAVMLFAL